MQPFTSNLRLRLDELGISRAEAARRARLRLRKTPQATIPVPASVNA